VKISEKRCQLQQRIALRALELAVADDGVERVQLRVESQAVKRRLYMCCSTVVFGVCDSVRLLHFLC
jgi:hypothetical protein